MVYRVFLSSTSQDLVAHREEVLAAIVRLDGFEPIAIENFGARADTAAIAMTTRRPCPRGPSWCIRATDEPGKRP